jgi:purine nucleosidase
MKLPIVFLLALLVLAPFTLSAQVQRVWLDADTGNEMDDLYAIARLVVDSTVELVGLSSAHFNNPDLLVFEKWNAYDSRGLVTVAESQRLNGQILAALGRTDIPHPLGADRQVGRAWGQEDPRDSPAARALIEVVRTLPEGEKLDVLSLGAATNVASALMLAPDILPRIRCYHLGGRYNPKTKVWNKNEFNVRNDLNAFDWLLNRADLELIVMPLEACMPLQFGREDTYARLDDGIEIEKILADRWREQNPQDARRIMWDLALVEAYLRPELARWTRARTPPENNRRMVKVYTKIDATAMAEDFWKCIKGR